MPGTKGGVRFVIFLVGCDAAPRLEIEQELVLTIYEMAEGTVVSCIESAAVPSEVRWFSRGVR